jgi:hypothetical protein
MTLKVYTSVLDSEIDEAGIKLLNFVSPIGNKSSALLVGPGNDR